MFQSLSPHRRNPYASDLHFLRNGLFPQSQIQVHLMTISSHKPHPEAAHPVINHTCNLPFVMTNSFIAIAEDALAIFFWIENPGLIIWNWKAGTLLAVSPVGISPESMLTDIL